MNALVRHLTLWELRRTLRGGTFRFMAAGYFCLPAVVLYVLARAPEMPSDPLLPTSPGSDSFSGGSLLTPEEMARLKAREGVRHTGWSPNFGDWLRRAPGPGERALLGLLAAQEALLFLLLAFWTVGTVRRMISDRVSDDWLLFLRYRDFLLSKYAAAFVLGSLLVLLGLPLELVALSFPGVGWENVAPALLVLWASVLIPVTVATFIGAAQDALLRHIAVVAMAVLGTGGLVYGLPLAIDGLSAFATLFNATGLNVSPTVFYGTGGASGLPWPLALLIQSAVLGVVWAWSWAKSEDFWQYPGLAEKPLFRPENANLAEVRQAVGGPASTQPTPNRHERFAWRQVLRRRYDDPVFVYDLAARQRWLGDTAILWTRWRQFVGFLRRFWWLVGLLLGGSLWYFWPNLQGWVAYVRFRGNFDSFAQDKIFNTPPLVFADLTFFPTHLQYLLGPAIHLWLVLAFGFLAAVVLAGSEIVAADRERGILSSVLLTRLSGADLFSSKVHVILVRCCLYGVVLLGALGLLALLGLRTVPLLVLAAPALIAYVITYTLLAVLVSAVSRTTLMAFFHGLLVLIAPTGALMLLEVSLGRAVGSPTWQALSPFLSLIAATRGGESLPESLLILLASVGGHLAIAALVWTWGCRNFTRLLRWREEV